MRSPYFFVPEYLQYRLLSTCPICGNGVFYSDNYGGCGRVIDYTCTHKWVQIGIGDGSLDQDEDGYYPNPSSTIVKIWIYGYVPLEMEVTGEVKRHMIQNRDQKVRLKPAKRYLDALGLKMGRCERAAFVETYAVCGLQGLLSLIDELIPEGIEPILDVLHQKMVIVAKALLS